MSESARRHVVRLVVHGRVQGVGYRAWAADTAQRLGLDGWVRNQRDGSVEILAIGDAQAIDALAAACRRGPPSAVVASVETAEGQDDGCLGFIVRPGA